MIIPHSRIIQLLVFLSATGLTLTSLFFEFVMELVPCPLCITQRITILIMALVGLIAVLHNPGSTGFRRYGGLVSVLGIMGAGLAIRQLYIQHLPPESAPACMPGLEYLVDVLPFMDLLSIMFSGTGDCAEVQWVFLGLSIPGWTLICFTGYTLLGIFEMVRWHKSVI